MHLPQRSMRGRAFALALVAASVTGASLARAQAPAVTPEPEVERARAAYDRGVRAHAQKDFAGAARAFAEADSLAPTAASLEAALEATLRADDVLLGAELVDRAEGRAADAGVARSLAAARRRFAGRTGKLRIDCRSEPRCLASVDGAAADARRSIYVMAGPHAVVVQRGDERIEKLVEVRADAVLVLPSSEGPASPPPPTVGPQPPGSEPAAPSGLAPFWFFVGLGATAVAGGLTIGSGLDAISKHDQFAASGCTPSGSGPRPADCDTRGRSGESAQLRTNVLLGATAVLAVATVAVGVFAVRWRDGTRASLTVGSSRSAALAGFELVVP